jgi:hypothetical protein
MAIDFSAALTKARQLRAARRAVEQAHEAHTANIATLEAAANALQAEVLAITGGQVVRVVRVSDAALFEIDRQANVTKIALDLIAP